MLETVSASYSIHPFCSKPPHLYSRKSSYHFYTLRHPLHFFFASTLSMPRPRRQTYPPRTVDPYSNQDARPAFPNPPPEYATLSVSTLPEYPSAEELDISNEVASRTYGGASRPRRPRREFVFKLGSTNTSPHAPKPWLTMRLMSNAPVSAQRPRYIGGEDVEGSVILNFEKPQTVSSVSVMVGLNCLVRAWLTLS